jgi:hypothetical protein
MLFCPSCNYIFHIEELSREISRCPSCDRRLDVVPFPALYREEQVSNRVSASEDDARCAFHNENQAEVVCSRCGRLICSICTVPLGKQIVCPQCLSRSIDTGSDGVKKSFVIWDSLALMLVAHPILIPFWFTTFFTAIASFVISIICFNKNSSPVPRSKWRFVLAIILSIVWIGCWIAGTLLVIHFIIPEMHKQAIKSN